MADGRGGVTWLVATAFKSTIDFVLDGVLPHLLDTQPIRPGLASERLELERMPFSASMLALVAGSKPGRDMAVYSVTDARG